MTSAAVVPNPFRANGAFRAVPVERLIADYPEMALEGLHGLAGEVVRTIGPETEADPVGVLAHFLVMFGSCIGRTPHVGVGGGLHTANLYAVTVGASSTSRKGTAANDTKPLFSPVDAEWTRDRIQAGLSSGEGVIWAVRDAVQKRDSVVDEGVADKRLLLLETEFAGVLRVLERDGNTLSAIIRQGWDSGVLRTLTKNSPAVATDAHISIIGHITQNELLRYLDRTEAANGFGNRFLWFLVRRSRQLPEGGDLTDAKLAGIRRDLAAAVEFSRQIGTIKKDATARDFWASIYGDLTAERHGLAGSLLSRAEAQALRVSMLYALLDRSTVITVAHIEAALAVWRFCEDSVTLIFGDALGDPVADEILSALRSSAEGLTRDQIRNLLQRHKSSEQIGRSMTVLARAGLATMAPEPTAGRYAERWRAIPSGARKARYARKASREPGEEG
jgi:hypothetical protein